MRHGILGLILCSVAAAAEPTQAELKDQFARAVRLFESDNFGQALPQFEQVYARTKAPAVLFNIAITHSALGQPIEAVEKFDALIAAPGSFSPERLERARQLREEQRARIAHLKVSTTIEPLLVEVDARSHPLAPGEAIALNPGQRFITVLAQGYLPWREAVTLEPGAEKTLEPKLLRSELKPAQVRLDCSIADVEVRIDGREVGRTPVPTGIGLGPGKHELSLRREGYRPLSVSLDLAEGATETLRFEPQPDPISPALGTLRISASESQAVIAVDGQPAGVAGSIDVPYGRHQLLVRRDGFFPIEREVTVPRGEVLSLNVRLEPTPELRGQLESSRAQHRLLGLTGLAIGGPVAIAGAAIIGVNRRPMIDATAALEYASAHDDKSTESTTRITVAGAQLTEKEWIQVGGLVTLGIGAVIAGAGAFSLLTSPDVGRYDAAPVGDSLAPFTSLQWGIGPMSLSVRGEF